MELDRESKNNRLSDCAPQERPVSLFESSASWIGDPSEAFENFVSSTAFSPGRAMRRSSIIVYCSMWSKFSRWLSDKSMSIGDILSKDFVEFSKDCNITGQNQIRYFGLLSRVCDHLVIVGVMRSNPLSIQPATGEKVSSKHLPDPEPLWLDEKSRVKFWNALPGDETWTGHRNRAMIVCMLGGGLKTSHVISLKIESIDFCDDIAHLRIYPSGIGRWHKTEMDATMSKELRLWLNRLETLGIPGNYVFPSDRSGSGLHASTVWRQTKECFVRSGLQFKHLGGSILRHTFAVSSFEMRKDAEVIREQLGHHRQESTGRYFDLLNDKSAHPPRLL